jgi:hypothetical protein
LHLKYKADGKFSEVSEQAGIRSNATSKSGRTISKVVNPTRSYLSQVELPITLGLGEDQLESLQITWPDGSAQTAGDAKPDAAPDAARERHTRLDRHDT